MEAFRLKFSSRRLSNPKPTSITPLPFSEMEIHRLRDVVKPDVDKKVIKKSTISELKARSKNKILEKRHRDNTESVLEKEWSSNMRYNHNRRASLRKHLLEFHLEKHDAKLNRLDKGGELKGESLAQYVKMSHMKTRVKARYPGATNSTTTNSNADAVLRPSSSVPDLPSIGKSGKLKSGTRGARQGKERRVSVTSKDNETMWELGDGSHKVTRSLDDLRQLSSKMSSASLSTNSMYSPSWNDKNEDDKDSDSYRINDSSADSEDANSCPGTPVFLRKSGESILDRKDSFDAILRAGKEKLQRYRRERTAKPMNGTF